MTILEMRLKAATNCDFRTLLDNSSGILLHQKVEGAAKAREGDKM